MAYVQIVIINRAKDVFEPIVVGDVSLTMERQGSPEVLTFDVLKDLKAVGTMGNFHEGNEVFLSVDGVNVFAGRIFKKSRTKTGVITVTAYSQLRYLKNKYTYIFENKKANEIITMIAEDYHLRTGSLADTGFVIRQKIEDNVTLFDMIQNAIDETLMNTGELFVMYDDYGAICLKNIKNMKSEYCVDAETAEDFRYTSSIDGNTFTNVVLYKDNTGGTGGERAFYSAVPEGSTTENMEKWGLLQYFEKVDENVQNPQQKAKQLLELYDKEERTLNINNALGDLSVRAGSSIIVNLNLGDLILSNYMVVEKITHKFGLDTHFMDLTLVGNGTFFSN